MTVSLIAGAMTLAAWREIYFGADITLDETCRPAVDAGAQTIERIVPLAGDAVEVGAHRFDPLGTKAVMAFAADFRGVKKASLLQDVQVLGDCLPRQA